MPSIAFILDPFGITRRLDLILTTLNRLEIKMAQLDDKLAQLQTDVTSLSSTMDSAVTLISGIGGMISDAVQKALEAGATPEQLQALTDATALIEQKTHDLAAAVTANTPQPPPADGGGQPQA